MGPKHCRGGCIGEEGVKTTENKIHLAPLKGSVQSAKYYGLDDIPTHPKYSWEQRGALTADNATENILRRDF